PLLGLVVVNRTALRRPPGLFRTRRTPGGRGQWTAHRVGFRNLAARVRCRGRLVLRLGLRDHHDAAAMGAFGPFPRRPFRRGVFFARKRGKGDGLFERTPRPTGPPPQVTIFLTRHRQKSSGGEVATGPPRTGVVGSGGPLLPERIVRDYPGPPAAVKR